MAEPRIPTTPVTDADGHVKGYGTLQGRQGRGVVDGKPYGEQLENERHDMATQYKFNPAARARLGAETRKALGRG